ncbi:PREDICTED: uncharacterized protein LOC107191527 [Dufourea novaeangliae]|uniref:Apolipoprotein D n=1 Tax=Dufourea novaeangliae TaxID=178035 RepID=A0A154PNR8_DUFNO|nr:PREDICTED: uncharacterized protein LOC107191527 [Dufourea novaeangliae]KZC13526.1 hypothetical protein WN55_05078 [Dufourea novaeangliae]
MMWCLVMLILAGVSWADNSVNNSEYSILMCPKLNSQEEIDLDKIMGKWYVVEVLEHKGDPQKPVSGSYIVDSCPIVKLRALEYSSLRLLWTEEAGNLEYTFRIPDISRKPGVWVSSSQQNGTLATSRDRKYNQFTGTVNVMKAVASDMVLTFCSGRPDNQLYSLLLAREHILQKSDKRGVHNLLGRRGLKIVSIRETCMNNAGQTGGSFQLIGWLTFMGVLSTGLLSGRW